MTRLRIDDGGNAYEHPVEGDSVRFGRLDTCDIVLEDGGISREHAELEREGDGWVIADLGSRNGTFVNDAQVHRQRLRQGDVVRLGPGVTIELLGAPAGGATMPPGRKLPRGVVIGGGAAGASAVASEPAPAPSRGGRSASRPAARGENASARSNPFSFTETLWELSPRSAVGHASVIRSSITTVGRDPGAGMPLDDESVSRMHARIDREGDALIVTDLKSSNGTSVNGENILRAGLRPGDLVAFGDVQFKVSRRSAPAWNRIALAVGAIVVLVAVIAGALKISESLGERDNVKRMADKVRAQALDATRAGIEAGAQGDADLSRAHLLYAADLLLLSDLAPRGSSLQRPNEVFREIVRELPADEREFDFTRALDPATIEAAQVKLATLTNREYIEHQIRRYAVELGQDPQIPAGFADQVEGFISDYVRYKAGMEQMLRRSHDVQPRIRAILATRHLPEAFCYVAWVESGLDPMQESHVGALGLWQLMPETAKEYHLFVKPGDKLRDERTNIERSTAAAADYFSSLLRAQGPEYFMLVLASYNRGHNALERAKQKIDDPMLRSTHKYWYLVEKQLLPEETRNYVPKIFAVRIVAEAPERFGFQP